MQHLGKSLGSVMLVDDSKTDNFINSKILELSGRVSSIDTFVSVDKALDYLSTAPVFPNLILLDVYMPIMNGFDFLEEYDQRPSDKKKSTKIVLISSDYEKAELDVMKTFPSISRYIVKPLSIETLDAL